MKDIESLKKELKRLKKWYEYELKRKDQLIAALRKENELLFKSALKQSEKAHELAERLNNENQTNPLP